MFLSNQPTADVYYFNADHYSRPEPSDIRRNPDPGVISPTSPIQEISSPERQQLHTLFPNTNISFSPSSDHTDNSKTHSVIRRLVIAENGEAMITTLITNYSVFVVKLGHKIKESDLEDSVRELMRETDMFRDSQLVIKARIIRNKNGISRGWGFIEIDNDEACKLLIDKKQMMVGSKEITIDEAFRKLDGILCEKRHVTEKSASSKKQSHAYNYSEMSKAMSETERIVQFSSYPSVSQSVQIMSVRTPISYPHAVPSLHTNVPSLHTNVPSLHTNVPPTDSSCHCYCFPSATSFATPPAPILLNVPQESVISPSTGSLVSSPNGIHIIPPSDVHTVPSINGSLVPQVHYPTQSPISPPPQFSYYHPVPQVNPATYVPHIPESFTHTSIPNTNMVFQQPALSHCPMNHSTLPQSAIPQQYPTMSQCVMAGVSGLHQGPVRSVF